MSEESIFLVIPTLKQGGAERVMSELANYWNSLKQYHIHLVLLADAEIFYSLEPSISVHKLGFQNKGKISKVISEFKVFFKLRKLIKSQKPLFVLSFMEKYNVFTIMASLGSKVPVYVSDRSNPKKKISIKINILRNLTYKYAAGIIAQTELAGSILKDKNKNIAVIHNPLKEIKKTQSEKENIILNVGRMVPQKGQQYLVEAFASLHKKYTHWELVILGDGPLREQLTKQITRLGIENAVSMPGTVKNVDEWLSKSSIYAFPSISEGFPNALAEAMSAGLPCVSFNCDAGPKDLIQDGINGYLTEVYDVTEFENRLEELILSEDLRDKISLESIKIAENLHIETIGRKYLNFCLK